MLKVEEIEPSAKCAERRVEFYLSTYLYRSEKLSYGAYVSKHACLPFIRTVEFREFTQADCSAQPLVELDFINLYRSMRSNPDRVRIKKKKKNTWSRRRRRRCFFFETKKKQQNYISYWNVSRVTSTVLAFAPFNIILG